MGEFRWIQMFLFLILELQITAVTGQHSSIIVRDGDDTTLPCENAIANQDKCDNTYWIFSGSGNILDLVQRGQIHENTKVKSDRLSVTADCSLVIKKVTREDVGLYYCQHISGQDAQVVLSVINMNKHEDGEQVTLSCSVSTHDPCRHTVKWLYEGDDVDEDIERLQDGCYGTVRFPTSHLKLKSTYHEIFQCKVTDGYTQEEQLFTFSPQSSGDHTTTAKTKVTIRTTENSHKPGTNSTVPAISDTLTLEGWWLYIIVAVGLVVLLIIVVVVIRWRKTTGNKTQTDEDKADPEGGVPYASINYSEAQAHPEDGVSYASVSYTKKTSTKARVQVEDDGDGKGDAVTYSTVKASSSSAGASTDPSNLYATINNPNK